MKKLILEEDNLDEVQVETDDLAVTNLISTLIQTTWSSIDTYNSMLITLNDIGNQEVVDTVNDIINSLYINIGQLENVLQGVNVQAQMIDSEQESDLGEVVIPEEDIQVDVEE